MTPVVSITPGPAIVCVAPLQYMRRTGCWLHFIQTASHMKQHNSRYASRNHVPQRPRGAYNISLGLPQAKTVTAHRRRLRSFSDSSAQDLTAQHKACDAATKDGPYLYTRTKCAVSCYAMMVWMHVTPPPQTAA